MCRQKRMMDHYRRFSFLSDIESIKSSFGEAKGRFFPKQPKLNKNLKPDILILPPDEEWFITTITQKIAGHPEGGMEYPFCDEPIFDTPVVGFIRGDDPIFDRFKDIIGPRHLTPFEIMKWQAEKNGVAPPKAEDLSVVSFVMPLTETTKRDNATATVWLSERWAQSRRLGEIFSQTFVREIVTELMGRGILAVSPDVTPKFNKKRYPKVGWASPWSHRHIAYAAGIGTFGIHDFLITEKGCAHRAGSFVVNLKLAPNRPRQEDIHAYCLHYQGIECLKCAKRCPVNAITAEKAHNKEVCYQKVKSSIKYCNKNYHIFIYGCGLCATGVPCESEIPKPL